MSFPIWMLQTRLKDTITHMLTQEELEELNEEFFERW